VPGDIAERYEVHAWRNATGVLATARAAEWDPAPLANVRPPGSEIMRAGGWKSLMPLALTLF
jgi:hypothetical protein